MMKSFACIAGLLASSSLALAAPVKMTKVFSNQFQTGVGNHVAITISRTGMQNGPPGSSQFYSNVAIKFSVKDNGYFAGAKSLTMPVGLLIEDALRAGYPQFHTNWSTVTLKQTKSGAYTATQKLQLTGYMGDSEQILLNGQFAMSANGKWDSANAANYKLSGPNLSITAD